MNLAPKLALALILGLTAVVGNSLVPEADLLVIMESDGQVYLPDGSIVDIPAGSEIDICTVDGSALAKYDLPAMAFIFPNQCKRRTVLFRDGFEP